MIDETLAAGPESIDDTLAAGPGPATRPSGGRAQLVRGDVVGRYVVLSRLGAGGMGVVYAAYDPELDRKVALKLLLSVWVPGPGNEHAAGRARLVREAQALAKFSHPEIVAVHDVGEHEAGVWLAMEFVDGRTLGAWATEPRSWREVVSIMLAAGRGVAAAHAAGLVHRDLKPDNIMVGNDGRVRVMDFGLTRPQGDLPAEDRDDRAASRLRREASDSSSPLTQQGSLLGTPAYMAPEQFAGSDVTPAADQFSFCVTLWELLVGERPFAGRTIMELAAVVGGRVRPPPKGRWMPSWLRRTCERGLAREPGKRWPSMQALLAELERGQSRARTRNLVIGLAVIVGLVAAGEGWRRFERGQRIAGCEAVGSIEELWNEGTRAQVSAGIRATGVSYAETTVEKLMPHLDEQADAWSEARTTACMNADVHETWDQATLERAVWCLDERRLELESLVGELGRADSQVLLKAVTAAAGLPRVSVCMDETVLRNLPQPPVGDSRAAVIEVRAELVHAGTLEAAGKYAEGLAVVGPARARAETLDWPPLLAVAHQVEGALLEQSGAYAEAETSGIAAYMEAARSSAWEVAADAATQLAYDVGYRQARDDEGRLWAGHAEVAIGFAGDPLGLREANRLTTLAILLEIGGEFPAAKGLHDRALALREQALGPEHPDVALSLNNLGNVAYATGEFEIAEPLYRRAQLIRERALGSEHPEVAASLNNLANVYASTGELERAKELYERALAIQETARGPEHADVAVSLNNLAFLLRTMGADQDAQALYERALGILEHALGSDHPDVATSLTNLGSVELALGRPTDALRRLERAVAIFDRHEGIQNNELPARFEYAKVLVATGGDRSRALEEATTARDGFRDAGDWKQTQLAEVETWLAEQEVDQ